VDQNESLFLLLAESLPDAVYVGTGGRFVYLNPAALRLFRAFSGDELLGQPILERLHPRHRVAAAEPAGPPGKEAGALPAERTYVRLDGTPVEAEESAVPFRYRGEDSVLVFVRDITERKRGEQALKALNRDFVTLLENTSDFIYFKDQYSRFRFCSQTLAQITGHAHWRDMTGKHDLEVFPEDTARIYYEEELPIFREGIPLLDKVDPYYDADGKPGWVSTSKWPVFGDDGKTVAGIFGISRIVTERVRAEAEERRLKRTLQLLNDSNTVLLHAEQEDKLLADICRLMVEQGGYRMAWVGFPQQDADRTVRPAARHADHCGYLDSIRISWADTEQDGSPAGAAIRTGKTQIRQDISSSSNPAPWREAAIRCRYRSIIGLPLRVDGVVLGTLAICAAEPDAFSAEEVFLLEKLADNLAFGVDKLRAKARLAKANKELQAFTYAASHDLKAPLGRINSFSALLERGYRDRLEGDGLQFLNFIRQNATRLTVLVDDLLAHAQVEQQVLNVQAVDLRALVESVLQEQADQLQQSGAELRLDLPPVRVQADAWSVAQVLRNLLDNALKYSAQAKPPIIEIGGQSDGERYRFWVRDNGIGFDMAYRERIFEIFRRLHTYNEYPGSGIGLALVKSAVERMGGRIWGEGAPGQGATFFVELPV
jgi:PAS domain S-box-containing protein